MLVTGRGGMYVFEMLRIAHCLDSRLTDGGVVIVLKHRPRSSPPKYFLFLSLVLISIRS
jgi:hypothetical protein